MVLDTLQTIFTWLAIPFIIWEVYVIFSPTVLALFVQKAKKLAYQTWESKMLAFYTAYMILGFLLVDWIWFLVLFGMSLVVEIMLNIHFNKALKFWLLRLDSAISIAILIKIMLDHI